MNQNKERTQGTDKREATRGEYKGNPLLILPLGENRDFSFGVGKARAILDCVEQIRAFVAEFEPAPGAEPAKAARPSAHAAK